jgi:hypothetical protein
MTLVDEKRASRDSFAAALLDFAEEPTPANVVRYLNASRELEESARRTRPKFVRHALVEGERRTATA